MEVTINVKHINALKSAKAKFSEIGDISHELVFDCVLAPGDLERLLLIFKQKIPKIMTISSPQSRMDLFTTVISEEDPKPDIVDGEIVEDVVEEDQPQSPIYATIGNTGDMPIPEERTCARCGSPLPGDVESDICGTCADDLRQELDAEEAQRQEDLIPERDRSTDELQDGLAEEGLELTPEEPSDDGEKPKRKRSKARA